MTKTDEEILKGIINRKIEIQNNEERETFDISEIKEAIQLTRQDTIKEAKKIAEDLNNRFRKDNTYVRLSADEFNDAWEEELKAKLEKMGK